MQLDSAIENVYCKLISTKGKFKAVMGHLEPNDSLDMRKKKQTCAILLNKNNPEIALIIEGGNKICVHLSAHVFLSTWSHY